MAPAPLHRLFLDGKPDFDKKAAALRIFDMDAGERLQAEPDGDSRRGRHGERIRNPAVF